MDLARLKALVDVVIPVLSFIAIVTLPLIGFLYKRRQRRARTTDTQPAWPVGVSQAGPHLPLLIRDARLTADNEPGGQPRFTLALTFGAPLEAPTAPSAAPMSPTSGLDARLPADSAVAPSGDPVTELRVSALSGTPAEEVLNRPLIWQVAGDFMAGFFRPRTDYRSDPGPGGGQLEAYRWSNLEVPPVFRRLDYLDGCGSGWMIAGSCWRCHISSYSSGERPLRPSWMRRGLYQPSM